MRYRRCKTELKIGKKTWTTLDLSEAKYRVASLVEKAACRRS